MHPGPQPNNMSQTADTGPDAGEPVVVTETAAEQALQLIEEEGYDPDEAGLRLFVKQGGCAGLVFIIPPPEDGPTVQQ